MAQLGQAYLAINKYVLGMMVENNFPVSALAGPKVHQDGSVALVPSFGFQYSEDLPSLIASSAAEDAFLRIDLNDILDIVDTIGCDAVAEAGIEVIPGHDRFAFGVEQFHVEISAFDASHDGILFSPAAQFVADAPLTAEAIEEAIAVNPIVEAAAESLTATENAPQDVTTEAVDAHPAPTTAKKAYDTPYLPRGQWLKMMREKGLLQPRKPRETLPTAIKAKPANAERQPKRVRSPNELGAIRRFYAVKSKKIA